MSSSSSSPTLHGPDWEQRLEEWRDGLASASEATAIEAHVASCDACQDYLEALAHIDAALNSAVQVPALSAHFDAGIWSRIESNDGIQRALAKQRAQEEMQQQLAALKAGWRRRVALMIPGILAGIALAFWFASLLNESGTMTAFASLLQQNLGASIGQLVQTIVTGLLGGAVGMAMSQWVVPTSE